jgi:hypothetical protein
LKKDTKDEWEEEQENAFQTLQQKLMSQPILQYPDSSKEFILTTDASNEGAGSILSQGEIGKDRPIVYASHSFNKAEKNYTTVEKKLSAIVWGIEYLRPYLYGRKFKVMSDHKPLTWIMSVKGTGSRLLRWRLQLEEYDYEIVYKPGLQNSNADALSRIGVLNREVNDSEEIGEETKVKILHETRDSIRRGMNKTYQAIKQHYHLPNMKEDIEEYVRKCTECQLNKVLRAKRKVPTGNNDNS